MKSLEQAVVELGQAGDAGQNYSNRQASFCGQKQDRVRTGRSRQKKNEKTDCQQTDTNTDTNTDST